MPQFPYIPLKGYKYHSPTRQAGITTHVPLCPEGKGQGHRDAPPHRTASRDARRAHVMVLQIIDFYPSVKKSVNRIKKRHQTDKRLAFANLKLTKANFQTDTCQ